MKYLYVRTFNHTNIQICVWLSTRKMILQIHFFSMKKIMDINIDTKVFCWKLHGKYNLKCAFYLNIFFWPIVGINYLYHA